MGRRVVGVKLPRAPPLRVRPERLFAGPRVGPHPRNEARRLLVEPTLSVLPEREEASMLPPGAIPVLL
jgi:hypothetical protein